MDPFNVRVSVVIVQLFGLIHDVLEIGSFLLGNYHFFAMVGNMRYNCIALGKELVFSIALSHDVESLFQAIFFGQIAGILVV